MKTGYEVAQIKRRVRKDERQKVIDRVLEIIDDEIKQRNEQFRVEHDLAAGAMLKERILALKGGEG